MATDIERLVVSLEANINKYEKSLQRALGVTDQRAGQIEQRWTKAQTKLRNTSFNTGNIAAQFQDIAVQLQGGASPFTVALQQGTQLSAALGSSGGGLKGVIGALGGAFGSLLNPISLASVAIIALGGTAIQYFTQLIKDGQVSAEELKKQEELIRKVADRWGDAAPALKDYVDQLDRAREVQDRLAAVNAAVERSFIPVQEQVGKLAVGIADATSMLQAAGSDPQAIIDLQNAFDDLDKKVSDQTATAEDAKRVQDLLAATIKTTGLPTLQQYATGFGDLARAIAAASAQAATFRQDAGTGFSRDAVDQAQQGKNDVFIVEQRRLNDLTGEQLKLETEIGRVKAEADKSGAVLTETQLTALAKERLAADERRSALTSSGKSGAREVDAVLELIDALQREYDLIGATDEQRAVANALREAGAAATDMQRQKIEELVLATMAEQESLEATRSAMESLQSGAAQTFSSFLNDVRKGTSAADALGKVFDNLASKLIDIAAQNLVAAAFGSLLGGTGGSALTGLGSIVAGLFGGKRAAGGSVQSGKAYLVGENGPELFAPGRSGAIVPNKLTLPAIAAAGGGGRNSQDVVRIEISDPSGMIGEIADRRIQTASGTIVQVAVNQSVRAVSDNFRTIEANNALRRH